MKTLLLLLFMLSGVISTVQAQTCYYYVSELTKSGFDGGADEIFTNIVSDECNIYKAAITNEYNDALRAEYPDSYYRTYSPIAWGPFDTRGEAGKHKRKQIADARSDGKRTIDFYFTYYGD